MSRRPTGKVLRTDRGADLVIERTFEGDLDDVWKSVTSSESTARWIGPWEGEPGPGKTVVLTMAFEEGAPSSKVEIETCEPPHLLRVTTDGSWRLTLALRREGSSTVLTFTQHLTEPKPAVDYGPGWEYYVDRIVAARDGLPMPQFSEYDPAQREYYAAAVREAERDGSGG